MSTDPQPAQAIILAAGRGERLRPWTDVVPKPLLRVGQHRLIEWHLLALARAGVQRVVINTAWLEDQFPAVLGDGSRYGVEIRWSFEGHDHGGALETGGGIAKVLNGMEPVFWVVSGDVFVPEFSFTVEAMRRFQAGRHWAHLWMVPNAPHHPEGDFGLTARGLLSRRVQPRMTWASLGLFRRELFVMVEKGARLPLRPLLDRAIQAHKLSGAPLQTPWLDVGTPARWAEAQALAESLDR